MPDEAPAKYWAFISYSHQDKRVARQLADKLAREPVPKDARDRVEGGEKRFSALFLDERESAAGSNLSEGLKQALQAAHALIVICSPFAVASPYVAQEIAYFHRLGRADRIFCLIASGQPNAADAGASHLECFPPPLRVQLEADGALTDRPRAPEDRPFAASLGLETPKEWRLALDQLVAGLLGITQSDLERARSRRQIIRGGLIAAGSVAALTALGIVYDGLARPQTRYYEDYARRDGVWLGLDEISARDQRQRNSTYAFRFNGRWSERPRAVEHVNGHGACHIDGMAGVLGRPFDEACSARRSCGVNFTYAGGRIAREELVDQAGNVVESLQFTGPSVGTFVEAQFPCTREAAGISFVQFERFEDGELRGFDREQRFLGDDRVPRPNGDGAYGFRFERDSSGQVLSRTVIGPNGETWAGKNLIARIDYRRDARGRILAEEYAGADGSPTLSSDGLAGVRREFDAVGNATLVTFFGLDGRPRWNRSGTAGQRWRYDAHGDRVSGIELDLEGQATFGNGGVSEGRRTYDSHGYVTELTFWNEVGEAIARWDGLHRIVSTPDEIGNLTRQAYFDVEGAPALLGPRYHLYTATFDERGQLLSTRLFGLRGEPVFDDDGVHGHDYIYSEDGRFRVEERRVGLDGAPTFSPGVEGAILRRTHDERGNVVERRYFDPAGAPALTHTGHAEVRQIFDALGRIVQVRNAGLQGALILRGGTLVPRLEREYDPRGNMIAERHYSSDDASGYFSGTRNSYDARDRLVETVPISAEGEPSGQITRTSFDDYGRAIELAYFQADGRADLKDGIHRERRTFDRFGRQIGRTYHSVGGGAASVAGVHEWRYTRDRYGSIIESRSFGPDRAPVPQAPGRTHHIIRDRFNAQAHQIERALFDAEGIPTVDQFGVSLYRYERDPSGLIVRVSYHDAAGAPVAYDGQYWGVARTYDQRGLQVSSRSLNAAGEVFDPPGENIGAGGDFAYDVFGRRIEQRNLDSDGQLARDALRASYRTEYDAFGRVIRIRNFDADGQPMNHGAEGWAVRETSYAEDGTSTVVNIDAAGRRRP